jgi:hypothetical protein
LYRWSDLKTLVQKLQEGVPEDGDGEGPAALLQAAAERLGLVAPGKPVLTASVTRELLQLVRGRNGRGCLMHMMNSVLSSDGWKVTVCVLAPKQNGGVRAICVLQQAASPCWDQCSHVVLRL